MLTTVTIKVIIEGMKRVLFWLLVLVLSLSSIFAADKWEYMVVGLGTAYFDSDSGKVTVYKDAENSALWAVDGASEFESALDILGKEGWEVVTVVGVIGGDQEFILKRPYDESRYLSDKSKMDSFKPVEIPAPKQLVDLDEADEEKATEEYESKMNQVITDLFKKTKYKMDTPYIRFNKDLDYFFVLLNFDMTEELLIGEHGYRKSQVDDTAKEIYQVIKKLSDSYPQKKLRIYFYIILNVDGYETKSVGNYKAYYSSDWRESNFTWSFEEY